jgi:hypothetical protein
VAVAVDAVGPSSAGATLVTGGALPLTWSHTCSGSNIVLIVGVATGATTTTQNSATTNATYGGTAMTAMGLVHGAGSTFGYSQMFYLLGAPAGTATVSVTVSASPAGLSAGSVSFTGAGSLGTAVTASGAGTAPAVSVTGTTVGNMVTAVLGLGNASGVTSSPQTIQWKRATNGSSSDGAAAQSTVAAPGGAQSMSFVMPTDDWGITAVEVKAAAAVAPAADQYILTTAAVNRAAFF